MGPLKVNGGLTGNLGSGTVDRLEARLAILPLPRDALPTGRWLDTSALGDAIPMVEADLAQTT